MKSSAEILAIFFLGRLEFSKETHRKMKKKAIISWVEQLRAINKLSNQAI